MTARATFRQFSRVVGYFAWTRAVEVLALQASPILGCFLGGFGLNPQFSGVRQEQKTSDRARMFHGNDHESFDQVLENNLA